MKKGIEKMAKLFHIVAGTDLHAPDSAAATRAAMLAAASGASMTLVHAIGSSALDDLKRWISTGQAAAQAPIAKLVREHLERACADLRSRHGTPVEARVGSGHPDAELMEVARVRRADVIVVGARGGGARGRLIGSLADRLVRTALRPVLLVRAEPLGPYRRVLLPVDFSMWSEASIHVALRVAPDAHFVLMHAVDCHLADASRLDGADEQQLERSRRGALAQAREKLEELAARAGLGPGTWTGVVIPAKDPWSAIVREGKDRHCDLIVIGKQGRSALGEFLLGSVARLVVEEATGDVLVSARP